MWLHIHELQFSVFLKNGNYKRQFTPATYMCYICTDMNEPLTMTLVNMNFRRSRYQPVPGSSILKSKANCLQQMHRSTKICVEKIGGRRNLRKDGEEDCNSK